MTRERRYHAAMDRLLTMLREHPENRWDMTDEEDREWSAGADRLIRHSQRLRRLALRWGC